MSAHTKGETLLTLDTDRQRHRQSAGSQRSPVKLLLPSTCTITVCLRYARPMASMYVVTRRGSWRLRWKRATSCAQALAVSVRERDRKDTDSTRAR